MTAIEEQLITELTFAKERIHELEHILEGCISQLIDSKKFEEDSVFIQGLKDKL